MFTEKEIGYIRSQRLARIATVSKNLQPDAAPVGFEFDGQHFIIRGFDITRTFKYKNVKGALTRRARHRRLGFCVAVDGARYQDSRHGRGRRNRRPSPLENPAAAVVELEN